MKKVLAMTVAAAMVMGLTACGSSSSTETTAAAETEAAAEGAEETEAAEELMLQRQEILHSTRLLISTSLIQQAETLTIWLVCLLRHLKQSLEFR